MGKISRIEWCTASANFWWGCRKISPGCANCFAERWAERSGRDFETVTRAADATFYAPLKWKEPQIIFTCSLSDFFIEEADAWRDDAWDVISKTPQHLWLILTKRPDLIQSRLPQCPLCKGSKKECENCDGENIDRCWPYQNVRLGISAENQRMLDWRVPELLHVKAAGYFVSAEPLLGGLDFYKGRTDYLTGMIYPDAPLSVDPPFSMGKKIDRVIVGGESGGPDYRSMVRVAEERLSQRDGKTIKRWVPKLEALARVRYIKAQCDAAGAKMYLKQYGGPRPESGGHLLDGKEYGGDPYEFWGWRKAA